MQQITFDIDDGLHCSSCERRLQALLLRFPGVRRAQVSRARGQAEIHYNPRVTTPDELTQLMGRGGFNSVIGSK